MKQLFVVQHPKLGWLRRPNMADITKTGVGVKTRVYTHILRNAMLFKSRISAETWENAEHLIQEVEIVLKVKM